MPRPTIRETTPPDPFQYGDVAFLDDSELMQEMDDAGRSADCLGLVMRWSIGIGAFVCGVGAAWVTR